MALSGGKNERSLSSQKVFVTRNGWKESERDSSRFLLSFYIFILRLCLSKEMPFHSSLQSSVKQETTMYMAMKKSQKDCAGEREDNWGRWNSFKSHLNRHSDSTPKRFSPFFPLRLALRLFSFFAPPLDDSIFHFAMRTGELEKSGEQGGDTNSRKQHRTELLPAKKAFEISANKWLFWKIVINLISGAIPASSSNPASAVGLVAALRMSNGWRLWFGIWKLLPPPSHSNHVIPLGISGKFVDVWTLWHRKLF